MFAESKEPCMRRSVLFTESAKKMFLAKNPGEALMMNLSNSTFCKFVREFVPF